LDVGKGVFGPTVAEGGNAGAGADGRVPINGVSVGVSGSAGMGVLVGVGDGVGDEPHPASVMAARDRIIRPRIRNRREYL